MARLPTPGGDDGNWGDVLNEYLEVEHSADGTHKTDYLPKSGGTMTGDVNADDNIFSQMEIKDYSETVVTANTGSSYAVDLSQGNIFKLTLTADCTISLPTAVAGKSFTILLQQDGTGSRTVTWDSALWAGGTAPTLTSSASAIDVLVFICIDGSNWMGFVAGQDMQ